MSYIDYGNTVDVKLINENNYVYKACEYSFSQLYTIPFTKELYHELVICCRDYSNRVYQKQFNEILEYVGFVYKNVPYNVRFNQIDGLIKRFTFISEKGFRKRGYTGEFEMEYYSPKKEYIEKTGYGIKTKVKTTNII